LVLEFGSDGKVTDHVILDFRGANIGVEIPPMMWHTFMALQEGSLLYEVREGPFIQETDKVFAKWAPEEGSKEAQEFNKRVLRELKISIT
jgi:cupin fold WbuC family metalloprotein